MIPWAPVQIIKTEIPFIISIMTGIINVIALLTKRFVLVNVLFASSKRTSSCFSVLNARITDSPVKISLVTRFNLSTNVCNILNFGIATTNKVNTTIAIKPTAKAIIHDMETFV